MKQGYQGYLDFQIVDDYGNILEHDKVKKIIFFYENQGRMKNIQK